MSKVFVLGLDGATLDVMLPMIEQGELPEFKRIMENGCFGSLKSVVPPLSPPAWVSFATGKSPGKNGIVGFTRMDTDRYRLNLVNGQDNQSRTMWDIAGSAEKKVVVLNVPMTYPPRPVNGLMISGLDTPNLQSTFTHPPGLKNELFSHFPDYKINLQLGGYLQNDRRRKTALRMILKSIESRYAVTEYFMTRYPWDLFVVKFNNPDIVQHHYWKYMDRRHPAHDAYAPELFKQAIGSVYKKLDEVAGRILGQLDSDTTLVVMSDHGAGARINKTVYINEWLRENGYLTTRSQPEGGSRARSASSGGLGSRLQSGLIKPLSFLFRHTSPGLRVFLKNMAPQMFSKLSTHLKFSNWLNDIDWSKTSAFLAEQEHIRINEKGVYPEGIVTSAGYEGLRTKIIEQLKELRDQETDESVFEDVLTREQAFNVTGDSFLPDIQLVTREAKYDITGTLTRNCPRDGMPVVRFEPDFREANGMHRPKGILFVHGAQCKQGLAIEKANITDLCPTILALLGVAIPTDLDGRAITEIFTEDFLKANPIEYKDYGSGGSQPPNSELGYSSSEEAALVGNLKSLGYMD